MKRFDSIVIALGFALFAGCGVEQKAAAGPVPNTGTQEILTANAQDCFVGGCSSQLCSDDPDRGSTCEWLDEYACYRDATCERQADGQCGWTEDAALIACLGQHRDGGTPTPPADAGSDPEPQPDCFVSGCSGQLCTDDRNLGTTCEWLDEYACYREATCERQADGQCGWTQDAALLSCLASH